MKRYLEGLECETVLSRKNDSDPLLNQFRTYIQPLLSSVCIGAIGAQLMDQTQQEWSANVDGFEKGFKEG